MQHVGKATGNVNRYFCKNSSMLMDGKRPPIERIELIGDYDLARKDELKELLAQIDGKRPVVFDIREVTYADSTFLHELGRLKARHPACQMIISGASPMIMRLLTLVAYDKLFTIDGCL